MISQGYFPDVGGAERQLASLAPKLCARGVEVTVYTKGQTALPAVETRDGVLINRHHASGGRAQRSLGFTAATLKGLRRSPPQLIHAHDLLSPTTTALLAKRMLRVPVVVKIVRSGHLGDIEWLRRRAFGRQRLGWIGRDVDRFVCISNEIKNELGALGVAAQRCVHVPNGVDTARFRPATTGRAALRSELGLGSGPIAIYTGRLAPEKRVDALIALWPEIRQRHDNAELCIVGAGEQHRQLAQAAGAGVRFVGAVDDVAPWLRAADLFVLPSLAEGLSNAMLEAMAAGLACVVTDVGGAADAIEPGRSGELVAPGDDKALRVAIDALFSDPEARARLGAAARERIKQSFSIDEVADRLCDLYATTVS